MLEEHKDKLKNKSLYKVGDISLCGLKIAYIITTTENIILYESESGSVCVESDGLNIDARNIATHKYNEIHEMIPEDISDKLYESIRTTLNSVYFMALCSDSSESALDKYIEIEKRIRNIKTPNEIKSMYISFTIAINLIVCFLAFYVYNNSTLSYKALFICVMCGCLGSQFSILQRNTDLYYFENSKKRYIFLQSTFTSLLGVFSGAILFILSKSGIALTIAQDNIFALAIFSIIAGFSERMIPDLFKNIENKNKADI